MATIPVRPIEVVKTMSGNSPFELAIPEAAGQTFTRGAVVTLDGNGRVIEATDPYPVRRILGIAAQAASNYTSVGASTDKVQVTKVWIANDDTVFIANLYDSQVTALTDLGGEYGLRKTGSNWNLDKATTHANAAAIVVGIDPRDNIGDIEARLHFIFFAPASLMLSTS